MREWLAKYINYVAWGTFGLTIIVSIGYWSMNGANVMSIYRLFPLLGLLAFTTMWGHYMMWALRVYAGVDADTYKQYNRYTHLFVLVCILLHPVLLIYKLRSDGYGLPPTSYESYVGTALVGFVSLGMVCLFAFLLFELKKYIQHRKAVWKGVMIANHLAMLGIVVHAQKIGTTVSSTGLGYVWPVFGLSLLAVYGYLAYKKKLI